MKRYGFQNIGRVILPLEDSFVRKLSEGGVRVLERLTYHLKRVKFSLGVSPIVFQSTDQLWTPDYFEMKLNLSDFKESIRFIPIPDTTID